MIINDDPSPEEEPRNKAWNRLKSETSFNGGMGREDMTALFGFIDELRSDVSKLKRGQAVLEGEVTKTTAAVTYITTVLDGDRFLGPGIFERLDKTQKSLDTQEKAIEQITRKVDESQLLSRQLNLQMKLLIFVFVLLFILLLFYVGAIYV